MKVQAFHFRDSETNPLINYWKYNFIRQYSCFYRLYSTSSHLCCTQTGDSNLDSLWGYTKHALKRYWDRLGPGTLTAGLAPGQTSPQATDTQTLWGTRNDGRHAQLGQIINKTQKGQKATAISEVLGAKAGSCAWCRHTAPPGGWADPLRRPPARPNNPLPPSPHWRHQPAPLREQRGRLVLVVAPSRCSERPGKASPEFLLWPLINSTD